MPDTRPSALVPSVYQLPVVVRGVSPLIWRRLLIPADTTIAGLHAVLQIAFGWNGDHLHRFVVHGREYGIASAGRHRADEPSPSAFSVKATSAGSPTLNTRAASDDQSTMPAGSAGRR